MARFKGVPVETSARVPRFKGVPVDQPVAPEASAQPNLSGMPMLGPILQVMGYDGVVRPHAEGYTPSSVPILDPINTAASGLVDSIPIVGPKITAFGNNVDAAFASLLEGKPVTAEERAAINRGQQAQYPGANAVGTVAGVALPLGAVGATKLGGKLLGFTGSLPQRAVNGVISGTGITYGDSLVRGDDPLTAAFKAAGGGLLGGIAPFAERGINAVVKALMGVKLPAGAAVLERALARDKIDPASLRATVDAIGPEAIIADVGRNVGRQAAAVASLPGEGQTIVVDALVNRHRGLNSRIQSSVDTVLGPAPVPSLVEAQIREGMETLRPEYTRVFSGQGVQAVDTAPLALELDSIAVNYRGDAQKAAQRVRGMLNITGGTELDPNPFTLFQTRQAIDGMLATEVNPKVIGVLTPIRQQIDEMLAASVPGLKDVDARYQELARQLEGLQSGQQVLDSGRTAPRPADVDAMMATGAEPAGLFVGPGGQPFRVSQGARSEIDRIIGTTANNLTALKTALKGDGSWNRDRLVSVFGQQKADALLEVLEREMTYQRTYAKVMENSETAARLAAQKDIAPFQFGEQQSAPTLTGLMLAAPQKAANVAAQARSEAVNKVVAAMLMGKPTPELVDQLIAARRVAQRPGLLAPAAVPLIATNQGG